MPLSPPVARQHLHTRKYLFEGFEREDGLFDIEGRITDTKTYGFTNEYRGRIGPDEAIHDMQIRLTLDIDMKIHGVEVCTNSSPYRICGNVAPSYAALIGEQIKAGWTRRVKALVGGTKGCTHVTEMLSSMGTVAFQTMWPVWDKRRKEDPDARPGILNTCHALDTDREVVKRFHPKFYTGGDA